MGMTNVPEIFGSLVFSDEVMHERLPQETFKALKEATTSNTPLDPEIAQQVASAMKTWAVEKGATHFTHWFQPMTGVTAEKHDSFITPVGDGKVIMDFSGKELIRSEPDASSFPSGGIRSTFEARGYTAWDPTSPAFIKDDTLCIPSIFCSYGGQVLDKKTPLLRSIQAMDKQAMRIVNVFGNPTGAKHVYSTVGGEQEYFLIDRGLFNEREDLVTTGRTLFGAKPPKGQEMEDHYFGTIKPAVKAFMADLDVELWKLGVYSKTEHNEVAPSQHEMAPIYTETNVGTDQNQLTMEIMKSVAKKHDLACLIHEKPFDGINGSGKHNNWSIATDTGINLFKPGKDPYNNLIFLVMLAAVVKGVDEYQDLLRACVASPGNDHRLGADEAPPAIVSIYLGDDLLALENAIEAGETMEAIKSAEMKSGVKFIPKFKKDNTDRNRTSPFAFTGNKFEFRMVGSSASLAGPNTMLNTILAEELEGFADILEGVSEADLETSVRNLVRKTFKEHSRIIFNGNNYDEAWVEEAERRGLENLRTCADAFPAYIREKNLDLVEKHKIYTREELTSRYEISMETYCKTLHIEALTMVDMVKKSIYPSVLAYMTTVAESIRMKEAISDKVPHASESELLEKLSTLADRLMETTKALEKALSKAEKREDIKEEADYYRDSVLTAMQEMRAAADELETITAKDYWPFPTYTDLIYSVN